MSSMSRAAFGTIPLLLAAIAAPSQAFAADDATATAGGASAAPSEAPVVAAGGSSVAAAKQPRLVKLLERRLVTSGSTVSIRGRAIDAPLHAELKVASSGRVVADAQVEAGARFRLQGRASNGERLQLAVRRTDGVAGEQTRKVGVVQRRKLRPALASWYGPGLFGNRTACGHTLTTGLRGVAHKTLPCGTTLTVSYRGRSTQARVVDRGPFHGGREFDLTQATARAIGFGAVGTIRVSR